MLVWLEASIARSVAAVAPYASRVSRPDEGETRVQYVAMGVYTIERCSAEDYEAASQLYLMSRHEPVTFLQAPLYGRLQERDGKEVVYIRILKQAELVGLGVGVVYSAPGGLKFLYFPYGPICRELQPELVADLTVLFQSLADTLGCTFVRIDNDGVQSTSVKKPIPSKIARTASLQPRAEWVLDISPDEETLWMGFHKHARYNVRLAERAEATIAVFKPSEAPLETLYSLMKTTGERDSFSIFDKDYYEAYLKTLRDDEGFVVLVSIDSKPAATGLFVAYDKQAHYVFAGSSNDFRKIAPAYSVIWAAMKEARKRGCILLNFGGVTDAVKGHDLSGVTGFKKRFGGYRVEHANPVDFVYKSTRYLLFKLYKLFR